MGAFAELGMEDCLFRVVRAFSVESRFEVTGVVVVAIVGGKAEGGCLLDWGNGSTAAATRW